MRVRLEVAQHRVAFGIGLFEAIEGVIVFTQPAQNQCREVRRYIVMVLRTRFEFYQNFRARSSWPARP